MENKERAAASRLIKKIQYYTDTDCAHDCSDND